MTRKNHNVTLGDLADTTTLLCPRCKESYIHQGTVTVYNRDEDEPRVRKTTVGHTRVVTETVENIGSENPSYRRHGLTIGFWCEFCDGEEGHEGLRLDIVQHKGTTFIDWVFTENEDKA